MKSALTYPIVVLDHRLYRNDRDVGLRAAEVHRSLRQPRREVFPCRRGCSIGFTNFMTSYWPLVLLGTIGLTRRLFFAVVGGKRGKVAGTFSR